MKNKSKYSEQNRKHWQTLWFMYALGFSGEFSSNPGFFGWIRIIGVCLWRYCWNKIPAMSDDIAVLSGVTSEGANPSHRFFEIRPNDVTGMVHDWMRAAADCHEILRTREVRENVMWAHSSVSKKETDGNIGTNKRLTLNIMCQHKRRHMKKVLGAAQRFGIISKSAKTEDYINSAKQRQKDELEKKLQEKLNKPLEEKPTTKIIGRY